LGEAWARAARGASVTTAVITAAGQGIGHASALALAAEGAQVWATDVNETLLERYAGVANVKAAKLDVLDKAAITAFVQQCGRLDVLFNCAGFVHHGTVLDATDLWTGTSGPDNPARARLRRMLPAVFAFALGARTDAPLAAVGGAVLLMILSAILDSITALGGIREGLPGHYAFAWADALSPTIDFSAMATGALWSIGYAVVLIGSAVWHFLRKDITS